MNESGNRKVRDWVFQKPVPECMGSMINIFELSSGMAGTKMLTGRAHTDGSVCGTQPNVAKKRLDPVAGLIEDKPVTYEPKRNSSNKRYSGTPMKMLIAQEMSKETDTKQKPPSVVARLMGLDGLPVQQPLLAPQGTISNPYNKHSADRHDVHLSQVSGGTLGYEEQENGYFNMSAYRDMHPTQHHLSVKKGYKDVYEVWPQQSRANHFRDQSLSKGRYSENLNEKRMALVRQKFIEAKRLATDQNLLQSKEFQEALDVLSSNRDLFLKFLEEPNSLFSRHLEDLQTVSTAPQTKHITVLKPSKCVDSRYGNEMREHQQTVEDNQFGNNKPSWSSGFSHPKAENLPQPTRIVVLKPSPRKPLDLKDGMNSRAFCTGLLDDRYVLEELGAEETRGSREIAKEITQHMRKSLSGNGSDDTSLSSVLSNGYIGNESSFNRSENEFIVDGRNFSDSEIVSPSSRHSWDNINLFGSTISFSSLSRASYSPESSVIREAKKRLSERWAMVVSNGSNQEQRQVLRSSSTLGEMLAIPETKKEEGNEGGFTVLSSRSYGGEQDVRLSVACSSVNRNEDGSAGAESRRNLPRSKSVPATSLAYNDIRLNVKVSSSQVDKAVASKDSVKLKSGKSSLKGKVSSLFFSRNKKLNREKSEPSSLAGIPHGVEAVNLECTSKNNDAFSHFSLHGSPTAMRGDFQNSEALICGSSFPAASENGIKTVASSTKAASSLTQVGAAESACENQDQPSPISVLEAPFEDDVSRSCSRSSGSANLECRQLISRSPPIESVARSLSWDESRSATGHLKLSKILSKADRDEDNCAFVKSLLSSAGFDNEQSSTAVVGWHSLESPLDPSLIDKFLEHKEEGAKCRERRSNQRWLFDSINAALLDISRTAIDASRVNVAKNGRVTADASLTEEVWVRVRKWFHGEEGQFADQGENSSLAVGRVLKNEVAGSGWMEMLSSEKDLVGKEIEGELLKELVGEALADLIPGWL